jgi:hypothetical protein
MDSYNVGVEFLEQLKNCHCIEFLSIVCMEDVWLPYQSKDMVKLMGNIFAFFLGIDVM